MKNQRLGPALIGHSLAFTFAALTLWGADDPAPKLSVRRSNLGDEVTWPATIRKADGSMVRPLFELQRSADLRNWKPFGERLRASLGVSEPVLSVRTPSSESLAFFRLLQIEPPSISKLGQGGAEIFGYGEAFARELQRIGQITPEQFAGMFPAGAQYLPGLSWDPTTAQFWDQFRADPAVVNRGKEWGQRGYRYLDTRLSAPELELFKQNGFVVSERSGGVSFAQVFYNLWYSDLPIFLSCDAILEAWHRTYDAMLEEIEETYLFHSVQTMLGGMAAQVSAAAADTGDGVLKESLLDADYFLAVARSLLAGSNSPARSVLGQDARVAETLADIRAEQLKDVPDFMGFCRMVDFSQFKVRGHYTHSQRLGRYFQCLMWLGRIDIPVAGGPWKRCPDDVRFTSPRETGVAVVLWHLLNQSGQFDHWADMERVIGTFVGWTDSLTFGQLAGLLAGAGIRTLADVPDLSTLERLQSDLVGGELGVQNIRSDWFGQPLRGPVSYALPQTFTVFGQKFVPDSWVFSQTVFDSIFWVENGETNKVPRRVPGALDVAFSVLGNDQVVPELVAQMKGTFPDVGRPHALQFRDGQPYQHNLAAVRRVMDQQAPGAWDSNLYVNWLACLRELSWPTTDARYPEAMRTRPWALKTLNTQLASWTQLRHDTILYAKQSYTVGSDCLYPKGFVEPRVEFWRRLQGMATRMARLLAALQLQGSYTVPTDQWQQIDPSTEEPIVSIALTEIRDRQVAHLQYFAEVAARLEDLSAKELARECFTPDDEQFVMREVVEFHGGSGPPTFTGWFPKLFYHAIHWDPLLFDATYGSAASDALVADVHTDVPCGNCSDPGSVLHEAVGWVNLLLIAVDNGPDRFICAGPVSSHYEFEVIGPPRRLSDNEWGHGSSILVDRTFPPDLSADRFEGLRPPPWTRSYLVP